MVFVTKEQKKTIYNYIEKGTLPNVQDGYSRKTQEKIDNHLKKVRIEISSIVGKIKFSKTATNIIEALKALSIEEKTNLTNIHATINSFVTKKKTDIDFNKDLISRLNDNEPIEKRREGYKIVDFKKKEELLDKPMLYADQYFKNWSKEDYDEMTELGTYRSNTDTKLITMHKGRENEITIAEFVTVPGIFPFKDTIDIFMKEKTETSGGKRRRTKSLKTRKYAKKSRKNRRKSKRTSRH